MSDKAEVNPETAARVDCAIKLERYQSSICIMFCGWAYRPDCEISIADAMKAYVLRKYPMHDQKTISQSLSRDTVGDAVFSRIFLNNLVDTSCPLILNVVTSDYHVKRTREIFEFVYAGYLPVSVIGVPGFRDEHSEARECNSIAAFRNTFHNITPGDISSIFLALSNNHPFYNGLKYSKIGSLRDVARFLDSNLKLR